jgi:hypothetical protein
MMNQNNNNIPNTPQDNVSQGTWCLILGIVFFIAFVLLN